MGVEIIDQLQKEHNVIGVYSLFSGGHDSLVATHLASQHPDFDGVIHIDTGTGLPETRQFVEETCEKHGWNLIVKQPYMPYEGLIMKLGFPGPMQHGFMYARLKDRPLRALMKKLKKLHNGDRYSKLIFISGVRKQESNRRAEIQDEPHVEGARIWTPVITDWTATDCTRYIKKHKLDRSPVKDMLHISGECFCGAYKKRGEFQDLEMFFPKQAERIRKWQELVVKAREIQVWEHENGLREEVKIEQKYCQWGPAVAVPNDQIGMFPMCQYCRD